MTYTNQSDFTHTFDKFEYHMEDFDCKLCLSYKARGGHGCGRRVCEFQDLKDEAIKHNRLKRPRGWWKSTRPE